MFTTNYANNKLPHRRFRLYVGNGNWVTLSPKTTDDLNAIFRNGVATRYEIAPGLSFDILPNDVDCNSKNTDLARLMRVDLCYDDDDDEEKTQQALSGFVKRLLETQGTMDAFPPPSSKANAARHRLPAVTDLPSHRHLSLVPAPPSGIANVGSGRRRPTATTVATAASSSSSTSPPSPTPPLPPRHGLYPLPSQSPFSHAKNGNSGNSRHKRQSPNKRRRSDRNKLQQQKEPTLGIVPSSVATANAMVVDARGNSTTAATEVLQYHYHTMDHHPLLLSRYDKDFFPTSPPGWQTNTTTTGESPGKEDAFGNTSSGGISVQLYPQTSSVASGAVASSSWLAHTHHRDDLTPGSHHHSMAYFDKPPTYDNVMAANAAAVAAAAAAAAVGLPYTPVNHSSANVASPNSQGGEIFIPTSSEGFPFLHQASDDDLQSDYAMHHHHHQQQEHVSGDEHGKM